MRVMIDPVLQEDGQAGRRWFVVQSRPHKERYASGHLGNQGYQTFLPEIRRTVRHARRKQTVLRPLFPRYLFVALDLNVDRWRPVLGTFGVSALVMDGERPRPVPAGVVEALAEAADGQGGFNFQQRLSVGQAVRFLTGPFADKFGKLVEMDDTGRVGVLMEILGAERIVSAAPDNLLPAGT